MLVICIDTACSLGMCAERNAIANMITNGENGICRLIAVDRNGKAIPPCGACREFMVQLMPDHYHSIQIMMDYENKKWFKKVNFNLFIKYNTKLINNNTLKKVKKLQQIIRIICCSHFYITLLSLLYK